MMNNFIVEYDISEFGNKLPNFPKEKISKAIVEKLIFMTIEEAREEIQYNRVLTQVVSYKEQYKLEMEDIMMVDENIVLFLKVKDIEGINSPKLIPYNGAWFLIGTGPHSEFFDIEMCFDMEEYSRSYQRMFGNDHSFAYFCTIDENLEVIDWHKFYNYHDDINKKTIEEIKTRILHEYKKYIKQISAFKYRCIRK